MIIPWTKVESEFFAGCEFGRWLDEELLIELDPTTKTIEELSCLYMPVLPPTMPIELKGIAV